MILTREQKIGVLVAHRYPKTALSQKVTTLANLATPEERAGAALYREELDKKGGEEIDALHADHVATVQAALAERARLEEANRFYNQAHTNADFNHWCRQSYWTLDEATALTFGKAPEWVTLDKLNSIPGSQLAFQYRRRMELAKRAVWAKQLWDPVYPSIYLAWAKRLQLDVAPGLLETTAMLGIQIADWKTSYDSMKEAYDTLKEAMETQVKTRDRWLEASQKQVAEYGELIVDLRETVAQLEASNAAPPEREKGVSAKERDSLLKLVIGMAVGGYGHVPSAGRSKATAEIAADVTRIGLRLDEDTVRKWLREAAAEHPPQTEQD